MYTKISKGSSQGLIQLSSTWQALQAGFLQNGHGFSNSHISGFFFCFFLVFFGFLWFPGLRNPWKLYCLITDAYFIHHRWKQRFTNVDPIIVQYLLLDAFLHSLVSL